MVIWEIECSDIGHSQLVSAKDDQEMVTVLVSRGFNRILTGDLPYQDEPLALTDGRGREWSAMRSTPPIASTLPVDLVYMMSKLDE